MDLSKLPRMSNTPPTPVEPAASAHPASAGANPPPPPAEATFLCPNCASVLRVGARFCDKCGVQLVQRNAAGQVGLGAEAWISIAMGVILLLFLHRPIEYWHTRSHPEQFTWTFNDKDGNPITYPQSAFFLPDVAFCAFCAVMIFEGVAMLAARRAPAALLVAFILLVLTSGFNLIALAASYKEIGFQIFPALAIAFGIYLAIFQIGLYRSLRAAAKS